MNKTFGLFLALHFFRFILHPSSFILEKWRSIADSWGRRRLDAAGLHRRKVWQTDGLRSSVVGSEHGEMALLTLEKPPLGAIFHYFFDDFLRVFLRAFPSARQFARMRPRKPLVSTHAQSREK